MDKHDSSSILSSKSSLFASHAHKLTSFIFQLVEMETKKEAVWAWTRSRQIGNLAQKPRLPSHPSRVSKTK